MRIKAFFNKITNNMLPAGVWGDNFDNHCKQHPEEFDIIYDETEAEPAEEAPEVYTESQLKTYSMADLRAVYEAKAEGIGRAHV